MSRKIYMTSNATDDMEYWLRNYMGWGFGDYLFDEVKLNLPKQVFFNPKKGATTLLDYNDNATVVKTTKGDKFDREKGFLLTYFQKYSGLTKTQANKYLKEIVKDEDIR